jgi:ATPase subunit of ABC transporter with duplicated ATPase domains
MPILVGLEHVAHEWPGRTVLTDATIAINEGERIGVVGRNGDGKSTLLSLVAARITPDDGSIIRRNNITVGLLAQHDDLSDTESVEHAVVGETPSYVWAADPRVRAITEALLADVDWAAPVGSLSGGQRRRVDLARVLVSDWDVLLLDEPTNHLDMRAIRWLAAHLRRRWPEGEGALLVVTHDRWFLDEVCEQMWEVHDGLIEPFEGGYSAYIQQRVERARQAQASELRRQNVLRKELNWLAHGAKARTSKPKFRIEAARALLAEDPPVRDTLELRRLAVARLGKQVIELKRVSLRYPAAPTGETTADPTGEAAFAAEPTTPAAPVLDDISWIVGPGERIGILGENGAGKTSLLRVMCGQLRPSAGFVKIGKTVRLAVMSQRLEELATHDGERMEELLASFKQYLVVDGKPQTPLQLAERLGFSRRDLPTYLEDLSGGQRRRLALLQVLLEQPNVLVLDEPGNDLDTDMLAVVEDLLDEWPGTLLLVTHDRYLMERVTDDQYALIDGKLRHCPGGVDEYLRLLDERDATRSARREASPAEGQSAPARPDATSQSPAESTAPAPSTLSNRERRDAKRRFDAIERRLAKLQDELAEQEAALAAHDPTDFEGLLALQAQIDALHTDADTLETEWLTLSDLLS